jgi:hypothetical protein
LQVHLINLHARSFFPWTAAIQKRKSWLLYTFSIFALNCPRRRQRSKV